MKRTEIRKFNKILLPVVVGESMSSEAQWLYCYLKAVLRDGPRPVHTHKLMDIAREKYLIALNELNELDLVVRVSRYNVGVNSYIYSLTNKAKTTRHKYVEVKAWKRFREGATFVPRDTLEETFLNTSWDPEVAQYWETTREDPDLFNMIQRNIVSVIKNDWNQAISPVCGRNYHTVAQMPRGLRKYLRIDGEETVEIDCKTLFPRLLLKYVNKVEHELLSQMIANDFYDVIGDLLQCPRSEAKLRFNKWLNGGKEPLLEVFMKRTFPSIYNYDRVDGKLGIELMRLEASVMVEAMKDEYGYIPVHDGAVVKKSLSHKITAKLERLWKEKGVDITITLK